MVIDPLEPLNDEEQEEEPNQQSEEVDEEQEEEPNQKYEEEVDELYLVRILNSQTPNLIRNETLSL